MANYLIAHDLGTSANKAALLDLDGHILNTHTERYPMQHPQPGFAQQNPELWWQAFCRCNQKLLQGANAGDVVGVAVTGQMMCCLPLNAAGEPLYPAMIWADTRAGNESRELEQAVGADVFYSIAGMRAAANYALPKMMWLKKHEPAVYQNTATFITPKDYINYRLCGRLATDPENAAYLHCYDLHSGAWSEKLLKAAGISPKKLPEILPAASVLGNVQPAAACACGLLAGTPVVVSTGDGGATTLGTGTIEAGEGYISLGTSSWVCVITGSSKLDPARSISKLNYLDAMRDSGTMQAGGFAYGWLKDVFYKPEAAAAEITGENVYERINAMAAASPAGANGVLFLPYLLGERAPLWDAKLQGAFLGLSGANKREDLTRSVLEGVAYHMNSIFKTILRVGELGHVKHLKMVGGGAKSALWKQIFADVFGVPIRTSEHSEHAGVLGTAVLAGVALGIYSNAGKVRAFLQDTGETLPNPAAVDFYRHGYELFVAAEQALRETNHRLFEYGKQTLA